MGTFVATAPREAGKVVVMASIVVVEEELLSLVVDIVDLVVWEVVVESDEVVVE